MKKSNWGFHLRCFAFCTLLITSLNAQESSKWPGFPGVGDDGFSVYSQSSFLTMIGAAALSYGLSEFVGEEENLNFYQVRVGMMGATDNITIYGQGFGLEKRLSSWYAIAIEFNNQQWTSPAGNGLGMGINTHYRWYAFGKKKLSPFLSNS